jgi:transposase InsO family protein
MAFWRHGRRVLWKGIGSPRWDIAPTGKLYAMRHDAPTLLARLLQSFDDVFAAPSGLPPARPCDHRIHLKPNTAPVAVRPYGYPQLQKDELEAQCASMLEQGLIRVSTSPFSAPVLLVRKPGDSWRFGVDYRALNSCTVKDSFPIPVAEELFDELHGARFFSKLDLRSGYHQVRVHPNDVEKTAFRTHHGHFEFLVMPFGLTNAPATFQALMNLVLQPFLRRCVLVFFDDILVYNNSWTEHLQHLCAILDVLRSHRLHVKQSKCSFATETVSYLGHIISADGVAMDSTKVDAMSSWPVPASAHALRGFLGLAGYYRRFIMDFGAVAAPLTQLLKKNAFLWSDAATTAFEALKKALTEALVLHLPDFSQEFVVDCDASGSGFGAILHQRGGPIAYFSRQFAPRHLNLAAYERELIGLVQAVRHWRPYLWGRAFLVRTDHYALKFMLDQHLSTIPQHSWVSKLFGYDFRVEYRAGRLNVVADALSRRHGEDLALAIVSTPSFQFYDDLRREIDSSPELAALRQAILQGEHDKRWSVTDGLIRRDGKVLVPSSSPLLQAALQMVHTTGPEGFQKTLQRLRANFFLEHDRQLVRDYVRACTTCQRNKTETLQPAGLLQPLPVPSRVWADISMDFVEALPKVHGKSVILTVVDQFSKYAHFIALDHPYTASSVARVFFMDIVRLHGFPESIVSDRDPVFTSNIWRELFKLAGVTLRLSTAFHPQTDGQSEAVNKSIAMYLRCITGDHPRAWLEWLPWAEYCYNTAFHSALRTTPFQVVYGRPPAANPALSTGYRTDSGGGLHAR